MNDRINSFVLSVLVCVSAFYVAALLMVSDQINMVQPAPYLDEIYHVPQAQEYCRGNFSYVGFFILYFKLTNLVCFVFISVCSGIIGSLLCLDCI